MFKQLPAPGAHIATCTVLVCLYAVPVTAADIRCPAPVCVHCMCTCPWLHVLLPQVRAMQIIDELEVHKRGPYGGGLGVVAFSGVA